MSEELTDFDARVGATIRRLREAAGLSQSDLSDALARVGEPMRQQVIAKVEAGKRPLRFSEAAALSKVLEVWLDVLNLESDDEALQYVAAVKAVLENGGRARWQLIKAALEYGAAQDEALALLRRGLQGGARLHRVPGAPLLHEGENDELFDLATEDAAALVQGILRGDERRTPVAPPFVQSEERAEVVWEAMREQGEVSPGEHPEA